MLKRNIAILVAAGPLGAQAGLVVAAESAIPEGTDLGGVAKPLPAQFKYLEQREAAIRAEGTVVRGDAAPRSADDVWADPLPAQAKHLDQRAAIVAQEMRGNAYKTIAIDTATKNVTVDHLGTVKFANDRGQSFVWKADTLGESVIPLKTIAPAGFETGNVTIYVRHPDSHALGG